MKKIFQLVTFIAMALLLPSCKNNDESPSAGQSNEYYTPAGNLNLISDEALQYLTDTPADDYILKFKYDTPEEALPEKGSIIVVPIVEQVPNGMLGRVVSIEKDSTIQVITEQVALDEAFENLSIDTEIDLIKSFDGVFDEEGNPIEYEFVDSLFSDTPVQRSIDSRTGEFYLEDYILRFPIKIYKGSASKLSGTAYIGFKSAKLDMDIISFRTHYVNFEVQPVAGAKFQYDVKSKTGVKVEGRIGSLRFRPTVVIPIGPVPVPVVVPITLYLDFEGGLIGEATFSLSYKKEWSPKWQVELRNGSWSARDNSKKDGSKESSSAPVNAEFSLSGSAYAQMKVGALVGLYSATSGIGINGFLGRTISANAKISSQLLLENPLVSHEVSLGSEVYCLAKIFGLKLGKYSMVFPKLILKSEKMYLLPQYENFEAIGSSSTGEITYQIDQHYFLEGLGVHTGTAVFERDAVTMRNAFFPNPTHTDRRGYKYYDVSIPGLEGGQTYYAAPMVTFPIVDWIYYGKKEKFTTEANYRLAFRCVNQAYDVINFGFSLNEETGNILDYTTEARDYNGSPMRIRITGQYDPESQTLQGVFDFYFYDDPSQQRKDGFIVSLAKDDSGYVSCNKVIDNGACYAALRIYKQSNSRAAANEYDYPLVEDDCNIGIFNKHYAE